MKNLKAGFVTMAALGVGVVLMLSVVGVLAMQKTIDAETKMNAVRHARYIAEDVIKTQIAIKAHQVLQRSDLLTFINAFGNPNTGLRIPIPGTDCGSGNSCNLVLLSYLSTNPSAPPIPPITNTTTEITLRIGLDPAQEDSAKYRIEPLSVTVKIPTQAQINNQNTTNNSTYSCNSSAPIFKGLKKVGNNIVADCGSITATTNTSVSNQSGILTVLCDVQLGNWMSSMGADLQPQCSSFSDIERIPASIEICAGDDQYPKSYSFNGRFQLVNKYCVTKGNPYDFKPEPNQ